MRASGWPLFAIKPSNYISGLCYSIFRLEPYSSCTHSCAYCYARWYRARPYRASVNVEVLRAWPKVARALSRAALKPFFRLSTLSDPFRECEEALMASLKMLTIAEKYEIPVVVNTKSTLITRSPWIDVVTSMADKALILVQVSIAFRDETSSILEPRTPPPSQRLEVVEVLKEHRVPVVVRVQPLIPGLEDEHLWAAREALQAGAKGVVAESIRETVEGFALLSKLLGYDVAEAAGGLEPYHLAEDLRRREGLYHPRLTWRVRVHMMLRSLATSYGAAYADCKEGLGMGDQGMGRDCCMAWLAFRCHALRVTLYELRKAIEKPEENLEELYQKLRSLGYACGDALKSYPAIIARALKVHEAKLLRILRNPLVLGKVMPSLEGAL